ARVQASKNNDAQSKFVASLSDADLNIFLSAKRKYRPRKIAWYTASIGVLVGFFGGIIGIIATQGLIGFYWVWFFGLIILSIASYVVFYTLMMRAEKIPDDKLKTARGTVYALHPEKVVFVPDAERLLVIMVGKDVDVSRLPKVGASVNVQYNGDKPRKCLIARTPRAPRKSTAKKSEEISDETIALDADPEV
ncbi:MAG: hypothetical protein FWC00_04945, partial [Firmicutes bacterium]|nr:hypothetical protein [Bacillota bacterium]